MSLVYLIQGTLYTCIIHVHVHVHAESVNTLLIAIKYACVSPATQ